MKSILLFLFFGFSVAAQTKLIAYKSHGGSAAHFKEALSGEFLETDDSNLGRAPDATVKFAELDSLIYLDKHRVVMVTSDYCGRQIRGTNDVRNVNRWKAGRDTVSDNALFLRRHELDSVKQNLKSKYYFKNDIDKVVFVGYDNKKIKTNKNKSFVIAIPGNWQKPTFIAILAVLSLILAKSVARIRKTESKLSA